MDKKKWADGLLCSSRCPTTGGKKKKRWFNKQPNKTADRRRHGPHHVKDESIDVCRIETCLGRLHRWRLSRLISFSSPLNVGGILFQQHKYITRKTLRCCGMIRSFLELQDAAGSFFSRNIVLLKWKTLPTPTECCQHTQQNHHLNNRSGGVCNIPWRHRSSASETWNSFSKRFRGG